MHMSEFLAMGRRRNKMLGHQANSGLDDQEGLLDLFDHLCLEIPSNAASRDGATTNLISSKRRLSSALSPDLEASMICQCPLPAPSAAIAIISLPACGQSI
jgi:hypothetical protein